MLCADTIRCVLVVTIVVKEVCQTCFTRGLLMLRPAGQGLPAAKPHDDDLNKYSIVWRQSHDEHFTIISLQTVLKRDGVFLRLEDGVVVCQTVCCICVAHGVCSCCVILDKVCHLQNLKMVTSINVT
jgi:hypothetical protein